MARRLLDDSTPMRDLDRRCLPAALAVVAALTGCAGHTLEPRLVDEAFTSAAVASPLAGPTVRDTAFRADADAVSLWLSFADVVDTHSVRVRWRDPRGRVLGDTGPVALNAAGGYRPHAGFVARLPLAGAPASLLAGTWVAEVSWDDRPLVKRSFTIAAADPETAR